MLWFHIVLGMTISHDTLLQKAYNQLSNLSQTQTSRWAGYFQGRQLLFFLLGGPIKCGYYFNSIQ